MCGVNDSSHCALTPLFRVLRVNYGYVQIAPKNNQLMEIDQLFVNSNTRRSGLGSKLESAAIKHILKENKGIHMMIQPGSVKFWKRYFNDRFNGKKMTLLGGEKLNTKLGDGRVFEISKESLVKNYSFPQREELKDPAMAKICNRKI